MLNALALAVLAVQAPVERDVSFETAGLRLHGTLTLPPGDGPWPGVVIVADSGPTDRDGNSPAGLATDMYRQLAHGLSELGIASLRYDKRGLPSTEGSFDMAAATVADFAADALAATRWLEARTEVGRAFLLGHGQGGTLAVLATRDGAPVRGLILVAAPATGNVPGYVAGIEQALLVVHGGADTAVPLDAALALAAANPAVTLELLPRVNHVLKQVSGEATGAQAATYANPALPLAPGLVSLIGNWIRVH